MMKTIKKSVTVFIVAVLWLVALLPPAGVSARAPAAPGRQETAGIQGEIAYVLEGDLWLHDLVSGAARQLTTDGDNLEPNWSPDGHYLVYSHGADLESADLYLLDVAGGGEPTLLVEQACCGAWSPDGVRIAYVDLSGGEPALMAINADGSAQETLLSSLTYGRGAYVTGKLDWPSESMLMFPLEFIDADSLEIYHSLFEVDFPDAEIRAFGGGSPTSGCPMLSGDQADAVVAIRFEDLGGGCGLDGTPPKGVALFPVDRTIVEPPLILPWLAAPSLSADGNFLAAERYAESDDPASAALWGVVAVNALTGAEVAVAAGARQPAWRPAAVLDPAALRFVQPGERLVTLEPPLSDSGLIYRISYLTTSDVQRRDASFLHMATPAFLDRQQITGLVVTSDGGPVTDGATLRRILERYHAAYHLYEESPPNFLPELGDELDIVLNDPLLMAMAPAKFLSAPRNQYAAALRAMLTTSNGEGQALPVLDEALADASGDVAAALDALGAIIADQHAANGALVALHADLKLAYESSEETVAWGGASLKLLRLAGSLLALDALQQERAGWLQAYVGAFPSGEGGLARDPLRATAMVLEEAESAQQQRVELVLDFAQDEAVLALLDGGGKLTQEAAAALAEQVVAKYGGTLSAQAVSSLLATLSVGLTVNGILYGTDELVANFQLAQRGEDLRTIFQAGAAEMQRQAAQRVEPDAAYSGELAAAYQVAVLLDALAGVAAYHAYADGVAASQRMPNLLTLLNTVRGEDWAAAAAGLHKAADHAERTVMDDLADPVKVDALMGLMRPPPVREGERLVEPVSGMAFVQVPAGEFVMGSTDEQMDAALTLCSAIYGNCERDWFEAEQPPHTVYLDEYWIGQTEVTNAQFQQFTEAGGYGTERYWSADGWQARSNEDWTSPRCLDDDNFNGPDQPVICVSWYEAEAYTAWLSEVSGMAVRLPSEAEWEKAARGTDGRTFPWGEQAPDSMLLNYNENEGKTTPVGSYPDGASPYGALDMAGNVMEWTADWFDDGYYSVSPESNPPGPSASGVRVRRGGSWNNYGGDGVRAAFRLNVSPDNWNSNAGFRCVRSQ